jgi:molybdopterin-guanine dinucleotide biosynthesis protein A
MTAAAILAGGRATRLGGALKPLLVVGGRRIIDRQLAVMRPLFDDIVLVANEAAPFTDLQLPLIGDRQPGKGPLAGIDAALAHFAARDRIASVVCVAGDMPFLAPALIQHLRDAPAPLALVPRIGPRPEPLCARYDAAFAPHAAAALSGDSLAMHALLAALPVTYVGDQELRRLDPSLRTFTNINTPDEWQAANAAG